MVTSSNIICRAVASLLAAHGVSTVVVSPGSRNAPLITAINASGLFKQVEVVVDERSAAFIALGMALTSRNPVAIVCTSGTALYNYAPAVAEAFQRHIPLIVVTADRPPEWIGQDDSQTLDQPGALAKIVKRSYNIAPPSRQGDIWHGCRSLNDAMLVATAAPAGPVHINVAIDEPVNGLTDTADLAGEHFRAIERIAPVADLTTNTYRSLARQLASPRKVMIVAGFMSPDAAVRRAVTRLAAFPNVVILAENVSNLWGVEGVVGNVDSTLALIAGENDEEYIPDFVISVGGALVSRNLKQFLRRHSDRVTHWQVGVTTALVDCFQSLSRSIDVDPPNFLRGMASGLQIHIAPCGYAERWRSSSALAASLTERYAERAPWSDFKVFSLIAPLIPRSWNLHLSNGTSIRYSQLFGALRVHDVECNRGVSGIDGSTSTAIGSMLAYTSSCTLLITGDMSALYDIGALFGGKLTGRMKIVVIDNGGGAIFRFIRATRSLPGMESSLALGLDTPFAKIASAAGIDICEASDAGTLRNAWSWFAAERERASMLVVHTDGALSAEILTSFFDFLSK